MYTYTLHPEYQTELDEITRKAKDIYAQLQAVNAEIKACHHKMIEPYPPVAIKYHNHCYMSHEEAWEKLNNIPAGVHSCELRLYEDSEGETEWELTMTRMGMPSYYDLLYAFPTFTDQHANPVIAEILARPTLYDWSHTGYRFELTHIENTITMKVLSVRLEYTVEQKSPSRVESITIKEWIDIV